MSDIDAICESDSDLGHWARFLRRYAIPFHDELALQRGGPFEELLCIDALGYAGTARVVFNAQGAFLRLDLRP